MTNPPSGTVNFHFTDIESSTRLAQASPEIWEIPQDVGLRVQIT